jgi:hypothetical protein
VMPTHRAATTVEARNRLLKEQAEYARLKSARLRREACPGGRRCKPVGLRYSPRSIGVVGCTGEGAVGDAASCVG